MSEFTQVLMEAVTPIVLAVAGVLAAWLGNALQRFLNARVQLVQQETARAVLQRVADVAVVAVDATAQTFVDEMKARSGDGKLRAEDAREAASRAFNAAWVALGSEGQRMLGSVTANPRKVVTDAIEAAVHARRESRDLRPSEQEAEMRALQAAIAALQP